MEIREFGQMMTLLINLDHYSALAFNISLETVVFFHDRGKACPMCQRNVGKLTVTWMLLTMNFGIAFHIRWGSAKMNMSLDRRVPRTYTPKSSR